MQMSSIVDWELCGGGIPAFLDVCDPSSGMRRTCAAVLQTADPAMLHIERMPLHHRRSQLGQGWTGLQLGVNVFFFRANQNDESAAIIGGGRSGAFFGAVRAQTAAAADAQKEAYVARRRGREGGGIVSERNCCIGRS